MHDDPGPLVDDEQVLVLVRESDIARFRHELRCRERFDVGLDQGPLLQPVALRPPLAVDEDAATLKQPLRCRARADRVLRREEAVEARPGVAATNA